MKKIFAFLIALLIAINILSFNAIKANAVALPASFLLSLIEACQALLVGSGAVSQSDFNEMNTSEVFDTTISAAPNIDLTSNAKAKADFIKNFNQFLNDAISKQLDDIKNLVTGDGLSGLVSDELYDFINCNSDSLSTPDDSLLNGCGAVLIYYGTGGYEKQVYYMEYGEFNYNTAGQVCITAINPVKSICYPYSGKPFQYPGSGGISTVYRGDKMELFGDWHWKDGSSADDFISELPDTISNIGSVDVDGSTYDVSGDGTVTIGDTTYTINDDGTVTINGNTYYPTYDVTPYDDTAIVDLLTDILNQIQVTEDDKAADIIDTADISVPIEIANSELSSLTLPKTIATVFPFCIPWDFYNGIKLLSQQPKAPRFEVPFEIPEFGLFPGFKKMIVLDFSEYESAFYVVRWVTFGLFMFGLCFITFKIVKGA